MAITNLAGAIAELHTAGVSSYNAAAQQLTSNPDNTAAREKLTTAIGQLLNAEMMSEAQRGRDGYAEVVKLMVTTASTASVIAVKMGQIVANVSATGTTQTEELEKLRVLSGALQALAQLSPADVWQKKGEEE